MRSQLPKLQPMLQRKQSMPLIEQRMQQLQRPRRPLNKRYRKQKIVQPPKQMLQRKQ
jgi:hypothetical protein